MLYHLSNTDATKQTGGFSMVHQVTIASTVLSNPSLIDSTTGLPLNGKINFSLVAYFDQHSLAAGDSETKRQSFSRECVGGLIGKQSLQQVYGLSAAQATAFFSNQITVTPGSTGLLTKVDNGYMSVGLRLFGD